MNKSAQQGPVRILHVHNGANLYGSDRSLLRMMGALDRTRFESVVVLPSNGPLKPLIESNGAQVILHPRLSIVVRPSQSPWRFLLLLSSYPFSVLYLWLIIRRHRIDLVHTNSGVVFSPAMAARLAGVKHVWHIRDWFMEFRFLWRIYSRYIQRLSRTVVAVSNAVANQFPSRRNVVVVHNGFALEEFVVAREALRTEFRQRHGLGDEFVVGCVGRIKLVRKGQEILVEAAALLRQRGVALKILIVGGPAPGNEIHVKRLQNLVAELKLTDIVVFAGELADTRPAYAAMDVFALPSAQPEPFGGVVMEAMSMGLPVIATNIGGSIDQVDDGKTGFLVPPADPQALAEAILKLRNDPALCRRFGDAGKARISEKFGLSEMIRKLESVFGDAARSNARPGVE